MTAPATVAAGAASYYALDAAYRAATARTSIAVARVLMYRWTSLVDGSNLAGTTQEWLDQSVQTVLLGQTAAHELANRYTQGIRNLSAPNAPLFTPPPPRPPNVEQIRNSLEFTGIRQTARELDRARSVRDSSYAEPDLREEGEPTDRDSAQRSFEGRQRQILEAGIRRAAGAAVRHVTSAGHRQIEDNVRADPVAIGWARTTKPGSCYFCAMLASRGYVYKETSFRESNAQFEGIGEQKVHDNCGCGLRPIYSPVDPLPDRTEALEQLWVDRAAKFSGQRAINEFRKAYAESELAQPFRE